MGRKGVYTSRRALKGVVCCACVQAWRDVAVEARVRKDELRRCIKRKKLAFTLFKQWYWEAFDSDVQVGVRGYGISHSSPAPSLAPALCRPHPPSLLPHTARLFCGSECSISRTTLYLLRV